MTLRFSGSVPAIFWARRIPAIMERTSSGCSSVLVRMRGLSLAFAERSFTQPRDLAVSSVGAMDEAVAVVLLLAVLLEVGSADVELDVGRREARAGADEGDGLGDGR